ncbi:MULTISPECIES: TetR/AcrR family transcriptional regulator [Micrococcus]|uniref:TetR/AcrR family transcriptional regulator n=1 Tax=Micrococcus TaxID=1269 RepID=UPI000C9A458C|nr:MULTISPECIES: TetR/AcrR family transcriptional regulator [Micrococcus]MCV7568159.1 TetR/AcrR family transcriptional regulator [Micrococcus luteus]MCV7606154.1 TetR/AcrR family transcriptional regulator [Micrococcus luteus]MCV7712869.1 TetR/AcrR family transcriptional regulator [Micrococcus luteus]PMC35227.1 TetR family transcriptional regulator [Micrococcus luteus]QQE49080.1 TetR family transcriptional regulator [Micrococcus luteus]
MPQSSPTPRRGRPGYDRQTLLAECVELFNRHGYEATSMGMLATHLGISKSAIYHHVESKEAILDHAVTEALDALEACLDDVVASGVDAGAQVEAAIRGTLGVLAEKQPEVTLLLRLRGNSAVEVAAVERRREITRRFGDLLEAAQAAGAVRSDVTPRNLARLALGMINSIVDWYRPDRGVPGQQGPDQMIDAVTGVVLGGLRG